MVDLAAPLSPGSTIGILGGGQLGRMMAMAAADMGLRCAVLCPDPQSPAFEVCSHSVVADYDDIDALENFASLVDVATYEFENVPARTAEVLNHRKPLYPGPRALAVSQDRLTEKNFITGLGVDTAPFAEVSSREDLAGALATTGTPCVLKTRRFGYDGKGQVLISAPGDGPAAFAELGASPSILEGFITFECEISVIAARDVHGNVRHYDPVENTHRNHILKRSVVPARIDDETRARALAITTQILDGLDYVGVMGVEMFAEAGGHLRVNEIAPRVHNSGHWTQDACITGQFEQHIRAICGWPLGSTDRFADVVMENLIGDDVGHWNSAVQNPNSKLHVYGKSETRPGRKMGHVTTLSRAK